MKISSMLDKDKLKESLKEIIQHISDNGVVDCEDFYLSSLQVLRLITRVESQFKISLSVKDFKNATSLDEIIKLIIDNKNNKNNKKNLDIIFINPLGGANYLYDNLIQGFVGFADISVIESVDYFDSNADSIDDIANRIYRSIFQENTELNRRAVYVIGFSSAGLMAYLLSKKIYASNNDAKLILIDSYPMLKNFIEEFTNEDLKDLLNINFQKNTVLKNCSKEEFSNEIDGKLIEKFYEFDEKTNKLDWNEQMENMYCKQKNILEMLKLCTIENIEIDSCLLLTNEMVGKFPQLLPFKFKYFTCEPRVKIYSYSHHELLFSDQLKSDLINYMHAELSFPSVC